MSNRLAVAGVVLNLIVGLSLVWAQDKPATRPGPAAAAQPAKAYACPMHCEGDKTYPQPGKCPKCGMDLQPVERKGCTVELKPVGGDVKPAVETTLEAQLKDAAGQPVKKPNDKRDRILFVVLVSDDLSWFAQEHPELGPDGQFTLKVTFPQPGKYKVYYDVVPDDFGWHPAPNELTVAGQAPPPVRLKADADTPKEVGAYTVGLEGGTSISAGRDVRLAFTVSRGVIRLATLQVYLAAPAQLFLVSQDLEHFVHVEPVDQPGGASSGPVIEFRTRFPTPGLYRGWYMFRYKDSVFTAPFTFDVSDVQKK